MSSFKLFFNTHKWTGMTLSLIFATTSVTGFMLLLKKRVDWIQPATQQGAPGELSEFITVQELFEVVFAQKHPDFKTLDDIDRVDFRPDQRVHKVRSIHNFSEFQVDAVTGEILSGRNVRRSDLLEKIHDGTFLAQWFHDWIMPVVAIALMFMVCSGIWLWLEPILRRRRRKKRQKAEAG